MDDSDGLRALVFQRSLSHLVDAIEAADVLTDPFPHFLVSGFFPADIYGEIQQRLPDPATFWPHSYRPDDQSNSRMQFELVDRRLKALGRENRAFWLGIRDALGCEAFKRTVFRKLTPGLQYRFGVSADRVPDLAGHAWSAIYRETSGYGIKPHPDSRKKVVTMQIALPQTEQQAHLGTEFYRRRYHPKALVREPRGFEIVKTTPFLPNSAYAFSVLNTIGWKSWHGRSKLREDDGVRCSILNIWHGSVAHANPENARDHDRGKAA